MKKLLLILIFFPIFGFGQIVGSITSLTIFPVNPTNTDTVYIYAELSFSSSSCPLDIQMHSIIGNNITASTQHCLGMLSAICNTTDTFKLNPLAVGTYIFDLTLSSGGGAPPCTPGIVPNDNDIITFNVINSVGIEDQIINKNLLKIIDVFGRETKEFNQPLFYIYNDGTVEKKIIID